MIMFNLNNSFTRFFSYTENNLFDNRVKLIYVDNTLHDLYKAVKED